MKYFMHRRDERLPLRIRNTRTASEPRAAISHQPTTNHGRRTDSSLTTLHRLHHGAPIAILARHPSTLQGQQLCTSSHNIILLLWFVSSTDLRLLATACGTMLATAAHCVVKIMCRNIDSTCNTTTRHWPPHQAQDPLPPSPC
eukprot:scaffold390087_cov139-Cyclotella_meneghiniana.AAC.1